MFVDIIIILIIGLCIFIGYQKGLIKVAVRLISFIAALVIALILYRPISNYVIENTEIVPNIKNTIQSKLYTKADVKEQSTEEQSISKTMENYINEYTDGIKESTSSFISEELAITIVRVGTWIILFAGIKLLMLFINLFADAIAEIPVVKQFNKAGGIIYGILEGFVIVYAILAVLNVASPMLGGNGLYKKIEDSHVCKFMYENNLLLKIIL